MTDAVAPAGFDRWPHPSPVLERLGSFWQHRDAFTAGGRLVAVARGLFVPA
jgi:hypothetical protein